MFVHKRYILYSSLYLYYCSSIVWYRLNYLHRSSVVKIFLHTMPGGIERSWYWTNSVWFGTMVTATKDFSEFTCVSTDHKWLVSNSGLTKMPRAPHWRELKWHITCLSSLLLHAEGRFQCRVKYLIKILHLVHHKMNSYWVDQNSHNKF